MLDRRVVLLELQPPAHHLARPEVREAEVRVIDVGDDVLAKQHAPELHQFFSHDRQKLLIRDGVGALRCSELP